MIALASAAVLGGAGYPPGASAAPRVAPPTCSTSSLVIWLEAPGNGAAGSIFYQLEFTNLSGNPCSLLGYPGVSAVGLSGHQLGSAARRDTTTSPKRLTLAGGASATAVVQIVEAGNFPTARCEPTSAAGLRVYPPGDRTAKVVPFPFAACTRAGPVFMSVQPVGVNH